MKFDKSKRGKEILEFEDFLYKQEMLKGSLRHFR